MIRHSELGIVMRLQCVFENFFHIFTISNTCNVAYNRNEKFKIGTEWDSKLWYQLGSQQYCYLWCSLWKMIMLRNISEKDHDYFKRGVWSNWLISQCLSEDIMYFSVPSAPRWFWSNSDQVFRELMFSNDTFEKL